MVESRVQPIFAPLNFGSGMGPVKLRVLLRELNTWRLPLKARLPEPWGPLYSRMKTKLTSSQHVKYFDQRYLQREMGEQELGGIVNVIIGNLAAFRAHVYSKAMDRKLYDHAGWSMALWCKGNETSPVDSAILDNLGAKDQKTPLELIQSPFEDFMHATAIDLYRSIEIIVFIESGQFDALLADLRMLQLKIDETRRPNL